jgi:hypothetical protein
VHCFATQNNTTGKPEKIAKTGNNRKWAVLKINRLRFNRKFLPQPDILENEEIISVLPI